MPEIDWSDLRVALAVGHAGTLAAAARELKVNATTVLRRLDALEQRLGARLFDRARGGFSLRSVHPGFSASDIRSQTGFDYVEPAAVPTTPLPDAETLALLRGRIMDELAETYPAFARSMLQAA